MTDFERKYRDFHISDDMKKKYSDYVVSVDMLPSNGFSEAGLRAVKKEKIDERDGQNNA